ncbi:hypothetical protein ACWCYL_19275 [Streptomyces sp. 900105755]|uniref:hypothetical protein n=1 Tax=Streptomyces sp. 900105755 TaxID=3154389 RepID=UPI00332346B0
MLFLGLLLLAATVAFTALAIVGNMSGGPGYTVSVLDHHIATLGPLAIFCAGLALALIFCLALAVMTGGALHHRHGPREGGPGTASGRFTGPAAGA